MAEIKAVIDIGTNTFNLLIGEIIQGKLNILHSSKEPVKLGQDGMKMKLIQKEAVDRAIVCLEKFFAVVDQFEVDSVRLIATSAMRNATNSNELILKVKQNWNWDIEVVTGEAEFELISRGVSQTIDFKESTLIMDIGGGSLELIYVENQKVVKAESFECGVARMFEWQALTNPMTKCEIAYLEEKLESFIDEFLQDISPNWFVGSSGSFETFYEMIEETKINKGFLLTELNISDVTDQCDYLIGSTYEERLENRFIDPVRKLMAPLAAIQLKKVLELKTLNEFFISEYSLKEGVFFS